jgi:hypothetical protein
MKQNELKSKLFKLNNTSSILKLNIATMQRNRSAINIEIDEVKLEIEKEENTKKVIKVSDHAVLRYLERVGGMDLNAIRQAIVTDELIDIVSSIGGSGKFPLNEGHSIIMKDYVIVTLFHNK